MRFGGKRRPLLLVAGGVAAVALVVRGALEISAGRSGWPMFLIAAALIAGVVLRARFFPE